MKDRIHLKEPELKIFGSSNLANSQTEEMASTFVSLWRILRNLLKTSSVIKMETRKLSLFSHTLTNPSCIRDENSIFVIT
jgi:hypothetical protein